MSCRTKYLGLFSHHFSWNSSGKYPLKPLSHSIFDRTEKCGSPLLKHSEVTRCSEPSKQTQKSVKRVFLPEFTAEKLSHTFNRARRPKFPRNFAEKCCLTRFPTENPIQTGKKLKMFTKFWEKWPKNVVSNVFHWKSHSNRWKNSKCSQNFEKSTRKMLSQTSPGEKTQIS